MSRSFLIAVTMLAALVAPAAGAAALPTVSRVAWAQAYPSRIVMRVFSPTLPMALTLALGPV
jgi:hypothetical protein